MRSRRILIGVSFLKPFITIGDKKSFLGEAGASFCTCRYFFHLVKTNYAKKVLLQVKLDNDETTSDLKKVNKQIQYFFSDMYKIKLDNTPLFEQEKNFNDFAKN